MSDDTIRDMLSGMDNAAKREVLDRLVISLLRDLNDEERREMLRKATAGEKGNRQLTSLVEH